MSDRNWIQTHTGRKFTPLDPKPEDVSIEDIAHQLALRNRFSGATREPYSVAEHSVRVSLRVAELRDSEWAANFHKDTRHLPHLELLALLHDAGEAYLPDVPSPVKKRMRAEFWFETCWAIAGFDELERRVLCAVLDAFGLPHPGTVDYPEVIIEVADRELLATEKRDLMGPEPAPWASMPDPLPGTITPWPWECARDRFLDRFHRLHQAVTSQASANTVSGEGS